MRDATPEERIAALRHLRFVNHSDVDHQTNHQDRFGESAEYFAPGNGEPRARNRLSARLSRVLGGGGGERSRPVSGVPSTREESFLPSEPLATVQSVEEVPPHPPPPPSNH